ncbi:hypothetical protein ACG9XR_06010 [Acinetobacter guillouiae]|uniref:hypothetical protein n=1 Tax=Acinetobacter guillouiae TaxID=106649 RepID=UPI003AF9D00E
MPYSPSSKNKLILNFEGSYARPSRYNLILSIGEDSSGEQQNIGSIGLDSFSVGQTVIRNRNERIQPIGLLSNQYGLPDTKNYHKFITLSGLNAARYGQPNIITKNRYVRPGGYAATLYGKPLVDNRLNYIRITGFNSFISGEAKATNLRRYVAPEGLGQAVFGSIKIEKKLRYLGTTGRDSLVFGTQKIESLRSFIRPSGLGSFSDGRGRISFNLQKATVKQENVSTLWGAKTFVAFSLRYIEAHSTFDMAGYGKAWIEYNPRYIEPRGLFQLFPSNHQIGMSRSVGMLGHDSARFGTRIIPENQTLLPTGFSTIFGETKIHNYVQNIFIKGFLTAGETHDQRWGWLKVFNSTQYLAPFHYDQDKTTGKWQYEDYTSKEPLQIFNRKRRVPTFGTLMQKFGYADIVNGARIINPVGLASSIEVEATKTMVADHIRHFRVQSIEPPHFSTNHIIWLSGKRYSILGVNFKLFGIPHVENTRRIYRFISLGEQSLFGRYMMISHAIRNVAIQGDYTIAPPVIPIPDVKHGVRYTEARGIDSVRYGAAYVEERFTKIAPRWIVQNRVGEPQVRNKTPQLRARGISMDEYGQAYIVLYSRPLYFNGLNAQIFGRINIEDRKQKVDFRNYGVAIPEFTKTHIIEEIGAGNYLPKRISPAGMWIENFPREGNEKRHIVRQNVISPLNEKQMTEYGTAIVTANTIRVEPGYYDRLYGNPRVEHKNRRVYVEEWKENLIPPEPRSSPLTIWVTDKPPEQARRNHPPQKLPLHHINGYGVAGRDKPGIAFGTPKISHYRQRVTATWGSQLKIGGHRVWLQSSFIRPKGFNNMRMGQLGPIGTQFINFIRPQLFTLFGTKKVEHIEPRIMPKPLGFRLSAMGKPTIDHFHREIKITGLMSQSMGARLNEDSPYMWQGLRIGAHFPFVLGGGIQSRFGTTWISNRVREIQAVGLDSAMLAIYDQDNFQGRLQVWMRQFEPAIPKQVVQVSSFISLSCGVPDIKPDVHFIKPDGNSDNFRKGGGLF